MICVLLHDISNLCPAQLEMLGVARQRPPDVWHAVDLLGLLDVLEHLPDDRVRVVFGDQFHGGHGCSSLSFASGYLPEIVAGASGTGPNTPAHCRGAWGQGCSLGWVAGKSHSGILGLGSASTSARVVLRNASS